MSLDSSPSRSLGLPSNVVLVYPEVEDYSGDLWCPLCNQQVEVSGTPQVPVTALVDDVLVNELSSNNGSDRIPIWGAACESHRHDVVLPAPAGLAPQQAYAVVEAEVDGQVVDVAVPKPVLSEVQR